MFFFFRGSRKAVNIYLAERGGLINSALWRSNLQAGWQSLRLRLPLSAGFLSALPRAVRYIPVSVSHGISRMHPDNFARTAYRIGPIARRDPANRQQNLRAFVAERRRNQRARRSSGSDGERDSGISVLVPSGRRRGSPGHLAFATPGGAEEQEEEEEGAGGEVAAARRNIGLDFDEEDRSWGVKRGAEGGATEEVKEEEGVEEKEKDEDSVASSGGNDSGASSRSPSPSTPSWRNREQERAVGGEAADALEGVHPGLATYDSQRAAGVDGGDRAGQEEYARMLELMQQVSHLALCLVS